MNKVLIGTILGCGLLLLDSPRAAAHDERGGQYYPLANKHAHVIRRDNHARRKHSREYYRRYEYRNERDFKHRDKRHDRSMNMPKWMKHEHQFRRWLVLTGLDRNRYLSWDQLFDIYWWEHSYPRYRRY